VSSIVELALWRVKMDKSSHGQSTMDWLDFRVQCHISCGAHHVILNVLPFLWPPSPVYDVDLDRNYESGNDSYNYYSDNDNRS
jgi:hypothetical protein